MNLNKLILNLIKMRLKHGNLPVYDTDGNPIIGISVDTDCGCCAGQVFIEAEF